MYAHEELHNSSQTPVIPDERMDWGVFRDADVSKQRIDLKRGTNSQPTSLWKWEKQNKSDNKTRSPPAEKVVVLNAWKARIPVPQVENDFLP